MLRPLDLGGDEYCCISRAGHREDGNEAISWVLEATSTPGLSRVIARGALEGVDGGVYGSYSVGGGELDSWAVEVCAPAYKVALEPLDLGGDGDCLTLKDGKRERSKCISCLALPIVFVALNGQSLDVKMDKWLVWQ